MANYEATKYNFNGSDLTGIEGIPTATIVPWSTSSVPTGFLECNGAAVSRSTYAALFTAVGTTYGAGDGSSTFNVPDLQDNVAMGKSGTKALASTGGSNTVSITATGNVGGSTANATLSTAQLASHSHPGGVTQAGTTSPNPNPVVAKVNVTNTGNTGSGQGHSHNMSATFSGTAVNGAILQPYLTIIYVIKT
jgi:microcystin-dependent protein|tara:strand:- start:2921 stop:3499 length:579 start_codon:yes stop_codon:yes gene_type:complete